MVTAKFIVKEEILNLTLTGEISLDFVNTVDWRSSGDPKEFLHDQRDFVLWARHAKVISLKEEKEIANQAGKDEKHAAEMFAKAIDFREVLFRIFSSVIHDAKPNVSDLSLLNRKFLEASSKLKIEPRKNRFAMTWSFQEPDLEYIILKIAHSAGEFLTSERIADLSECQGAGCNWLFIDTSRKKNRRWCDMKVCGNRAKARRHYVQTKAKLQNA